MPSLLEQLTQEEVWQEYLQHKHIQGHLNKREEADLVRFIEGKTWLDIARRLASTEGSLGVPEKCFVNKMGKASKRVVYCFESGEQQVLKVLAWLLYRYDSTQHPCCYSFRRGFGAHKAIRSLTNLPQMQQLYCYKVDIQDYFNSIDISRLLPLLAQVLCDDEQLYSFFERMLTTDVALVEGVYMHEKRGVMAGTPTAPFLANIYLAELDHLLGSKAAAYARYSDDIIMFAATEVERDLLRAQTESLLARYGLRQNPHKEFIASPGEAWEFLGVSYHQGRIDLSQATQQKLKGKIRRKARALRRWMLKKDASTDRAVAAMIRSMNKKFFERGATHELTWSRWFFPLINTSEGLRSMDNYLQQELRTIATGRHTKTNYKMSYQKLKELGYRSLVHEYYQFKADFKRLTR